MKLFKPLNTNHKTLQPLTYLPVPRRHYWSRPIFKCVRVALFDQHVSFDKTEIAIYFFELHTGSSKDQKSLDLGHVGTQIRVGRITYLGNCLLPYRFYSESISREITPQCSLASSRGAVRHRSLWHVHLFG